MRNTKLGDSRFIVDMTAPKINVHKHQSNKFID